MIKAVDLFCGIGGLTYGLQKAGITVVAGIDIDDSCEYAYTHNNNCKFIHKSVEDVTGKEIRSLLAVHHVNLFRAIKKIRKIALSIKTGNYSINLGVW